MMHYILSCLECLAPAFSRGATRLWFCSMVLSLILGPAQNGSIQSRLNALNIGEKYYTNADDNYRSTAIDLEKLTDLWYELVLKECTPCRSHGRCLIVGDGVKKPKEGRRMPGVTRLHSESGTQSKPASYHGIQAGVLSLLVKIPHTVRDVMSIPFDCRLMSGLNPIADWEDTTHPDAKNPMEEQATHRLEHFIDKVGDTYYITDRASMSQTILAEMERITEATGYKVDVITNARSNAVGYEIPVYKGRGRHPKRGKRVELNTLFSTAESSFVRKRVWLYGKHQTVRYYSRTLLWGLKRNQRIKFVLCKMEDGRKIILATSDLNLPAVEVIRLYGLRFGSIEEDFKVYKHLYYGMDYHFWTASMPHLSHFRSSSMPHILESVSDPSDRRKVLDAIKAAETYMMQALIAQGLTKLVALTQKPGGIVQRFTTKRTYTTRKVSENDVCGFLRFHTPVIFEKYKDNAIIKFIRNHQVERNEYAEAV